MAPGQARAGSVQSSPGFLPRIYWDDPAVRFCCPLSLPFALLWSQRRTHAHVSIVKLLSVFPFLLTTSMAYRV